MAENHFYWIVVYWLVRSRKSWNNLKTIFSICWKKFHASERKVVGMPQDDLLKRLLMSSCLSRPGWEMTLSYIFSQIEFGVPDNLLRPSIMWRVLLYWAGIDRNLHSIGKRNDHQCNVNVLSFCFSAYCNALFYCCGILVIYPSSEGIYLQSFRQWSPGLRMKTPSPETLASGK